MPATPSESTFELATIQRLQQLGYRYLHGSEIDRSLHTVVLWRRALAPPYAHWTHSRLDFAARETARSSFLVYCASNIVLTNTNFTNTG